MSVIKAGNIGLGIVGLGRGFMLTLPALRSAPGLRLVAACDPRVEARQAFSTEFGGTAYESLDELLSDPAVDAVYIATPQEFHAGHTLAATRAGKHVLVEKPMATSVAEARAMVHAARESGVVLMVGPSHGYDAPVQRAASIIASGIHGAVRMVTAFNFTDYVYRPRRPEELDPTKGGGVVFGQGAHQIDVVRRLMAQPATDVTACSGNWDSARAGEGAYTALIRFAGGAAASLTYSGYAHFDTDELMNWVSELGYPRDASAYGQSRRTIAAMRGNAEAAAKLARTYGGSSAATKGPPPDHHEHFGFVLASCERADIRVMHNGVWVYADEQRQFQPESPPGTPRAAVIADFIGAIQSRSIPIHDGEWGLETTRCCAALSKSSAEGRTVQISEV